MLRLDDTIAAIATPPGEGGVGIVRLSGPRAISISDGIFLPAGTAAGPQPSHTVRYGVVTDPATAERVDDALRLVFHAPHSYTGEDVAELQCHGGPVTLGRVLALAQREGARLAEPGEFTRRAFLNGRMDLAQAEAVCDQIRARTEAAQRIAVRQRDGALSREVARLRDELLGALAAVEVTIDFSDEVGDLDHDAMAARIAEIQAGVEALLAGAARGRVYREGVRLAIVGRPNVGKSSLLNALLRQDRAIVTPIAGTTRDVIEEAANIRGIPVTAIDTAGLRETEDEVERIGVERAQSAAETASMLLFVVDGAAGWSADDARIASRIAGRPALWVVNKADLLLPPAVHAVLAELARHAGDARVCAVSAVTGSGIEALEDAIADRITGGGVSAGDVMVSNVRHAAALEQAHASLREAAATVEKRLAADFITIDLRAALDALGRITGETAPDELVHRIFRDFCVGK